MTRPHNNLGAADGDATNPSSHKLFDLAPSTGYRVGVARSVAGYEITVAAGGAHMTTAAGMLTFELEGEPQTRSVAAH